MTNGSTKLIVTRMQPRPTQDREQQESFLRTSARAKLLRRRAGRCAEHGFISQSWISAAPEKGTGPVILGVPSPFPDRA